MIDRKRRGAACEMRFRAESEGIKGEANNSGEDERARLVLFIFIIYLQIGELETVHDQ